MVGGSGLVVVESGPEDVGKIGPEGLGWGRCTGVIG